tara:strand:- start:433 stop:726 length:294 start_codon:yes stop_codon:yes gene_type:complete
MKIFLAKYEHKHGTDERAFATRKGAQWQLEKWAEEYVDDWGAWSSTPDNMPASSLVSQWTDITGGNEFLYIAELPLLDIEEKEQAPSYCPTKIILDN